MTRWAALGCCLAALEVNAGPALLTDWQKQFLADAQAPAAAASKLAEQFLLQEMRTPAFRAQLLMQGWGSWKIAFKSAEELLEDIRASLHSSEFVFSFGLDKASAKLHPGQPDWSIKSIDEFGHIPTLWELKVDGKAPSIPQAQWELVDAEETGLYRQQNFKKPADPTMEEAALRPGYVSGNLVRFDGGIFQYGVYAPVYRQSVLKERSVVIGHDGGGWESVCNKTASKLNNHWWAPAVKYIAPCDGIFAGGEKGKVTFATMDNLMHAFYANTRVFKIFGEGLARRVYQMLVPGAKMHLLEDNMYLEAALFGPARAEDLKVMVASFPNIFGTQDADDLRDFCKRHKLPLAWALDGGSMRETFAQDHPLKWLPDSPFAHWEVNGDRLLDPSSWEFVNIDAPSGVDAAWSEVEKKVRAARKVVSNGKPALSSSSLGKWWSNLKVAGGTVHGLNGGDCADDIDLCFGISGDAKGTCICREMNSTGLPKVVAQQIPVAAAATIVV